MELTTRRIQDECRKILNEFIRICTEYRLRYYLIDGSMLGAVRHNGFIPWDDDMDIAMPRPDYERFCTVASRELPSNMYFVSYEESLKGESLGEIAHIFSRDMTIKMNYFSGERTTNVWIDIMIMYGMPKSKFWQKIHYKRYFLYKGLARMGRIRNIGNRHYSKLEKAFISIARHIDLSKVINTEGLLLRSVKLLKKYPYDKEQFVLVLPSEYGDRELVPKDYYEPGRPCAFEDLEVRIPTKAEQVLSRLYGDYMKFPPEEQRVSKHKVTIVEE